ncbi:RidA family protein [Bacillus sp. FJAT-49705]|uniref:RidA family protein n=2 Tax=Cytobacillus citreus TaxID=2833586 RepID=A0ABS5NQT3_9BACI|nr:RidA family protein [Cytobacillus citreus]
MMEMIYTETAPKAIGPYSQAMKVNDFLFLSGQIPVNPVTNEVVEHDIIQQTNQVMKNIKAILESEGLTLENIIKTTIFIKDMSQFPIINEEYSKYFNEHKPARSTVEVSALPKNVLIEIEAIAYMGQ